MKERSATIALSAKFGFHPAVMALWAVYLCAIAAALYLLPGAPYFPMLTALTLIPAVFTAIYRNSAGHSDRGEMVLMTASLLLALGIIANVYTYTTVLGGSDSAPVLINDDAHRCFNDALYYLGDKGIRSDASHGLFPLMMAGLFALTGVSVSAGLCVSMCATLCTLVCIGSIWVKVTGKRLDAWRAMACTAAVCYFIAEGTILIKDAWAIASFAIGALALTQMAVSRRSIWLMALSSAMLLVSRPNMLMALGLGVAIICYAERRTPAAIRRSAWMLLLAGVCFGLSYLLNATPKATIVLDVASNTNISYQHARHQVYTSLIGDYHTLSPLSRLALMPFTAAVQFFIPFPWNFTRDLDFGLSLAYAHISYPWYAFGGLAIYYLLAGMRRSGMLMRALFVWGVAVWLIPCWSFGGTISRYGLMALPMLAPGVSSVLENSTQRKSFKIFAIIFITLVAATLVVCHHFQSGIAQ